jgi:hypothetical protein
MCCAKAADVFIIHHHTTFHMSGTPIHYYWLLNLISHWCQIVYIFSLFSSDTYYSKAVLNYVSIFFNQENPLIKW